MSPGYEVAKLLKDLAVFDISPVFETNMPGFTTDPPLGIIPDAKNIQQNKYFTQILVISEHNGSHVDAPIYIHKGMDGIDKFPCGYLIGPYKKYDLTRFNPEAGKNIPLEQLKEVETRDSIVPQQGDIILLQFGWDKYYKPESNDIEDRMMYSFGPGITEKAVRYFAEAKIQAIGADVVSADTCFPDMPGHLEHFLPNGILIMESFINMAPAPATGLFVGLPWKIKNGSGSPMSPILFG